MHYLSGGQSNLARKKQISTCVECAREFETLQGAEYCSPRCRRKRHLLPKRKLVCEGCGIEFETASKTQIYHSAKCRKSFYARRSDASITSTLTADVSTGTIGAIGELIVAADLMRSGFHVFRSLSPSCPCDLAVMENRKLIQIEVKTGRRWANGQVHPRLQDVRDSIDVLAIILYSEGVIRYEKRHPKVETKIAPGVSKLFIV